MEQKIKGAIEKVRPILQRDGGDIQFVSFDASTGTVSVALQGACKGCPMSQMTVKMVVEQFIRKEVPEVKAIKTV
jgi:Fe-S cluster biogenesis protein NfuA